MQEKSKYECDVVPLACVQTQERPNPSYTGIVRMRIPTWQERLAMIEAFGIDEDDEAEADLTMSEKIKKRGNVKFAVHMATFLPKYFVLSTIKRVDDGCEISTLEDIEREGDLQSLHVQLGTWLLGRQKVGKTSAPSS